MTVLIRADASNEIGSGHIMRCLSLADSLRRMGRSCHFVAAQLRPELREKVQAAGHKLTLLTGLEGLNDRPMPHAHWLNASWQSDAQAFCAVAQRELPDWVVVDHYGLDVAWERQVATVVPSIAVIDDLADRPHHCAVLIDPNFRQEEAYHSLVAEGCRMLLGPRYALLRPEFAAPRPSARVFGPPPLHTLVAFSGADLARQTLASLKLLDRLVQTDDQVTIVINDNNIDCEEIEAFARSRNWTLCVNAGNLAALMDQADMSIGAGGGMLWERAARGLPAIAIAIAANQRDQVATAAAKGMVLGIMAEKASPDAVGGLVTALRANPTQRRDLAQASQKTVDGRGVLRVARHLYQSVPSVRRATSGDEAALLHWRNDDRIRHVSRSSGEISPQDHHSWLNRVLTDESRHLFVTEDEKGPTGVVRFDQSGSVAEVSIYLVPERLGSGLGAAVLLAAEQRIAQEAPQIVKLVAEVLPGNLPSEELFRSCGYRWCEGKFIKSLKAST